MSALTYSFIVEKSELSGELGINLKSRSQEFDPTELKAENARVLFHDCIEHDEQVRSNCPNPYVEELTAIGAIYLLRVENSYLVQENNLSFDVINILDYATCSNDPIDEIYSPAPLSDEFKASLDYEDLKGKLEYLGEYLLEHAQNEDSQDFFFSCDEYDSETDETDTSDRNWQEVVNNAIDWMIYGYIKAEDRLSYLEGYEFVSLAHDIIPVIGDSVSEILGSLSAYGYDELYEGMEFNLIVDLKQLTAEFQWTNQDEYVEEFEEDEEDEI